MFKKKKLKTKNKNKSYTKVYINIVGILSVFAVFLLGFYTFSNLGKFNFENNKSRLVSGEKPSFSNFLEGLRKLSTQASNNSNSEEKNNNLEKEQSKKVNLLLLGRGGGRHDAPNLTDTIILASINKQTKTITMLSIPRDLYVSYGDGKSGKINQIYALTRAKTGDVKKAVKALSEVVEKISGEKIDYYLSVDFKGFTSFIDAIGGVKITVPKNFVDNKFPDGNWGYRTLVIRKGTWLFDGETALKYVRSRHSTSDFDRSLRQQQIIKAIKDKLNEGGFFSKISKIKKFYDVFQKYVDTDLGLASLMKIYKDVGDYTDYEIISFNLNDSCFYGDPACQKGGFLYVPERELYGGASVLLPFGAYKGDLDNYEELSSFMDLIFNSPEISKENIQINVFNSTRIKGIAGTLAMTLKKYGFNIPDKKSIGNIRDKSFTGSIIHYNSDVKSSKTISFLEDILEIPSKQIEIEDEKYSSSEETKIEIILGKDYKNILENLKNNL